MFEGEGWNARRSDRPVRFEHPRERPSAGELLARMAAWARDADAPWHGLVLGLAVVALVAGLAGAWVASVGLPGADSGQWLMLARAYAGQHIPAYRDPGAVPPGAPLLVLALREMLGNPYRAAAAAMVLAFAAVPVGAFILGRELFGDLAGVVAGLMLAVGQVLYLGLMAFGAVPQLLAMGAFAIALAALARWHTSPGLWSALALGLAAGAVVAIHVPTAALALPVLALTALLLPPLPWSSPDASLQARFRLWVETALRRGAPLIPALAAFVAYTTIKREAFAAYLLNEAAYHRTGLDAAMGELIRYPASGAVVSAGVAMLALLALQAYVAAAERGSPASPKARPFSASRRPLPRDPAMALAVLGVPLAAVGFAGVAADALGLGIDYPRIVPLLALPALVALGAVAMRNPLRWPSFLRAAPHLDNPETDARNRRRRSLLAAGVVLMLLVPVAPAAVAQERTAASQYAARFPDALRHALDQVESRVPQDDTVWTPVREGKWLEGVTGRAALFELPAWAIYRPAEVARSEAAGLLDGGSAWLSSGLVAATFQRNASVLTANPEVAVYHEGTLRPLLVVDDKASRITLDTLPPVEFTFAELGPFAEHVLPDASTAVVVQHANRTFPLPSGASGQLELERTATLDEGSGELFLQFHAWATGVSLQSVSVALRPASGVRWDLRPAEQGLEVAAHGVDPPLTALLQPAGSGATLSDMLADQGVAGLRLELQPAPAAEGPASVADGTLAVAAQPVGRPEPRLHALTAADVLADYGVHWALWPKDGAATTHRAARALGFAPVYENAAYILSTRPEVNP